jgi:mRNA-degrading endonuclease RelE of RelBE toxin-antitoxin system
MSRVIYTIKDDDLLVVVVSVGHRSDVYRAV